MQPNAFRHLTTRLHYDRQGGSKIVLMISNEKRIWSEEEDVLLKKLYEEEMMRNWSLIAKRLARDFNLPRKSAKQCKER